MMGRACDRCLGTDTQRECEQGQCYAEEYDRQQQADYNRRMEEEEADYWRQRAEEEGQP
jgi:hypothetical protein